MVGNVILWLGILSLFYILSFYSESEIDIGYWFAAIILCQFCMPIKGYILKQNMFDITGFSDLYTPDSKGRGGALVTNILLAVGVLVAVYIHYFS